VTAELLSQLVEQPFYDELRTQQQLGYLVFSGELQRGGGCDDARWIDKSSII